MKAPNENTLDAERSEKEPLPRDDKIPGIPANPSVVQPFHEHVEQLQNSARNETLIAQPGCYERRQGAVQSERVTGASHTPPVCERSS
jgi:hypothetical protein